MERDLVGLSRLLWERDLLDRLLSSELGDEDESRFLRRRLLDLVRERREDRRWSLESSSDEELDELEESRRLDFRLDLRLFFFDLELDRLVLDLLRRFLLSS